MRILMLAQFYPPLIGGEERHVRNLAQALAGRGHHVAVATTWQRGLESLEMDGPVRIYRLRGTMQRLSMLFSESGRRYAPPFPDPELMFHLNRMVGYEKPDIVHAHNWLLHSYLPLKRSRGPRLVVTLHDLSLVCVQKNAMHGMTVCEGPGIAKCLGCASVHYGTMKGSVTTVANWMTGAAERQLVDRFLAVSRAVATGNRLDRYGVRYEVIPNFVLDDITTQHGADHPLACQLPEGDFLLYVGDLRRLKGLHTLLEAYVRLHHAPPLVLIGRRCEDTPKKLPSNVLLFESWPHAAVMHAWSRCMLGIVPSVLPESCASVLIEAMTYGKPVVATAVGGTPDLVEHEKTGLLVPPGDDESLASAMRRLIEDGDLRLRMGDAAKARSSGLRASAIVPRIEQVYADVLANTRRSTKAQREVKVH